MARSRSSSVASSTTLMVGSGVNIDYTSPFSPSTTQDDNTHGFHDVLKEFGGSGDAGREALLAALKETALEKSNNPNGEVSPNELFVTILSALSSLVESFESKCKNDESAGWEKEVEAIIPLLEILRRVSGFVVYWGNNSGALFVHQFGTISRLLRLLVALSYSLPSNDPKSKQSTTGNIGPNALLRQILKTSITLLLLCPPSSEKELAKLLHGTVIEMLHDARPKVRKAAWGAAMEIVMVASSSDSGNVDGSEMDEMNTEPSKLQKQIHAQRKSLADMLWEYCYAVVTTYSTKKKSAKNDSFNKLIHVMRFLETSLPHADDDRICVKFGEGCLTMLDGGNLSVSMEVVREALLTLLSCLEERDDKTLREDNEELTKFASRALAFLLQHRPNTAVDSLSPSAGDVFVVYGRCLLGCMEHMMSIGGVLESPSKLLAMKLLPNTLKAMLHLCEAPTGGGGDGDETNNAETCCSAFNQFVSRILPLVISCACGEDRHVKELHRVAMEIIPQCVPIIQQGLQIQYRNAWGSILPGGYATFTTTLAGSMLELRGSGVSPTANAEDQKSELETKVQLWISSMVLSLLRLRHDVEKDGTARTAVEYATSTLIRGLGLELFLSLVDFVDEDADIGGPKQGMASKSLSTTTGGGIRDDRAWILPLMKQGATMTTPVYTESSTVKTHLSFFQGRVLFLARRCDAASADGHRTTAEASIQKSRVIDLWALFPSFCLYPVDMKENFAALAKTVVKALGDHTRYPKLISIICGGLKSLTIGIIERSLSKQSPIAAQDYDVLSSSSTKILPSLFKLVENLIQSPTSSTSAEDAMETDDAQSSKEKQASNLQNMQFVESVTDAIGYLAQVCPREFLHNLFKKVVQRLLGASTEVAESINGKEEINLRMCSLLGLAQALVASGSLDEASLSLLFRAIRPLVRTDVHDSRVQKRAYKVLSEICERHTDFVTSSERLDELIDLMVESIVTAQVSARHMRLKCMTSIVSGFASSNQAHMAVIPKIMGEVLLCLKDSNAKTREAAYKLLLAMSKARNDITDFFKIILAALGAQTSHMRSAAVLALSRLTFEFARDDEIVRTLLPSLMETISVLFDDPAREVNKSVIGFVRVAVAAMTADQLQPLLPEVVGGLMKYNKGKDRFRAKIKIILKKLVRVYGYDAIAPLVPEKDTRLITHMRKLAERAARRKAAGLQDGHSMANDNFDNMMESDEEDSDDGRTFMTGVTGFTKMTSKTGKTTRQSAMERSVKGKSVVTVAKSTLSNKSIKDGGPRIRAELEGEILDLLDSSKMARSVRFADMNMHGRDFRDEEDSSDEEIDQVHFDSQGRIVISDGPPNIGGSKAFENNYSDDENDAEENLELKDGGKRRRVSKFESVKVAKAEIDLARSKKTKNQKHQTSSLGAAYKSKKAGGDVIKKGQKYEPYAYVPLNAKDFTKKNRGKAVSKMGTVVNSNKRKRK
ncbi:hypothetical protein HJC23_011522 [Cyclotella cryptica]|uniref:TOG domain-containing protein n=1 Tax=Cyclotella cryptica TaxID=29204 RepID=A0ABD3PVV6_9STRA|eukprot:CCRYP_011512-RA/>CCRYP_011512-RA protein AED:0.23 eAED:0.23 QI:212/1/1/1/0.75/0.6/5/406/1455